VLSQALPAAAEQLCLPAETSRKPQLLSLPLEPNAKLLNEVHTSDTSTATASSQGLRANPWTLFHFININCYNSGDLPEVTAKSVWLWSILYILLML